MSKTVVHMIGQAHLDPVWLWRWTEGRAEALATSRSAADRLSEYPDFHFVRGEAQVYEWIEQEDPRLFAQILTLIEQGRWHVVNGMIIQPDMNLPQGESIVRQILLGKAYMRERLGVEPTVAYCVDSFGHAGTLPQVFKKCGFEAYVFMRPGPHEKTLPEQLFWWQGPDGSRILAFRITDAYQTRSTDLWNHIERAVQEKPERLRDTMCFFGVGNHGGGPTREQIDVIHSLMQSSADLDIRFSSPEAYLAAIRPDAGAAPTVTDELQMHAVGCYSANSTLKRSYRRAECQLLVAERMAVLAAAWADRPAPAARLRTLWHELCLNQFHDTLSGSTTKEGADDAIMALGGIMSAAQEIANDAGRAIAAQVDTQGPGGAVLLFNPHAEDLVQYVEYEPWTEWESWESGQWGLTDEQGRAVPHQRIDAQSAMGWPDAAVNRLAFCAEVPALGYRLYRFARGGSRTEAAGSARIDDNGLSNDRLAIRLDPRSGVIVSCVDKGTGMELVGPEGWNVPLVLEDRSDTWSHGVQGYTQVIGRFGDCSDQRLRARAAAGFAPGRAFLRGKHLAATDHPPPRGGRTGNSELASMARPVAPVEAGVRGARAWAAVSPRCTVRLVRAAVRRPGSPGSDVERRVRVRPGGGWASHRARGPERRQVRLRRLGQHAARHRPPESALRLPRAAYVRQQGTLRLDRPGWPGVYPGAASPRRRLARRGDRRPRTHAEPARGAHHDARPSREQAAGRFSA